MTEFNIEDAINNWMDEAAYYVWVNGEELQISHDDIKPILDIVEKACIEAIESNREVTARNFNTEDSFHEHRATLKLSLNAIKEVFNA